MFGFERVWRNEQEEAFGCQITGNWTQILSELFLFFSSSSVPGAPTADRPASPPIFLLPAAPSSTSSWYSHHLSSSHLHLTSFTLSYMSCPTISNPVPTFCTQYLFRVSELSRLSEPLEDPLKEELVFRKSKTVTQPKQTTFNKLIWSYLLDVSSPQRLYTTNLNPGSKNWSCASAMKWLTLSSDRCIRRIREVMQDKQANMEPGGGETL